MENEYDYHEVVLCLYCGPSFQVSPSCNENNW